MKIKLMLSSILIASCSLFASDNYSKVVSSNYVLEAGYGKLKVDYAENKSNSFRLGFGKQVILDNNILLKGVVSYIKVSNVKQNFTNVNAVSNSKGNSVSVASTIGYKITNYLTPYIVVGLHRYDIDQTITQNSNNTSTNVKSSEIMYGLGVNITLNKNIDLELSNTVYKQEKDRPNLRNYGISLVYKY